MREIVIVIADLYLPGDADAAREAGGAVAAPAALAELLRLGTRTALGPGGWREWLAHWLGRADLASLPVAAVAAAGSGAREGGALWLATPMHWLAGLSGVHLDGRAILRLPAAELAALAADFNAAFRHSAVALRPLESGDLLAQGPDAPGVHTVEPARAGLADLAQALPRGAGAQALRRLGSEIEMWLSDQAVNRARAARGERTVSALWFWGGPAPGPLPAARAPEAVAPPPTLALGSDPYLAGLARLAGAIPGALPAELGDSLRGLSERAAVIVELGSLDRADPWSLAAALGEADRRFITPALAALRRGAVGTLTLMANDRCVALRGAHRLRLWRRAGPGLTALA